MSSKYIREREDRAAIGAQRASSQNSGSSVLLKIVSLVSAFLFSAAIVLFYQANKAKDLPTLAKVRSSFSLVQLRLQHLASTRENYLVCLANEVSCGVKLAVFEEAVRQYPGVEPVQFLFDQATFQVKGSLKYSGTDVELEPQKISIQLPKDILSATRSSCPADSPLLAGFSGDGKAICRKFEATVCESGDYVSAIDPTTLKAVCSPAGKEIKCAQNEVLSSFEWQGEDRVVYTCRPRLDPFIAWNFKPNLQKGELLSESQTGGQ